MVKLVLLEILKTFKIVCLVLACFSFLTFLIFEFCFQIINEKNILAGLIYLLIYFSLKFYIKKV